MCNVVSYLTKFNPMKCTCIKNLMQPVVQLFIIHISIPVDSAVFTMDNFWLFLVLIKTFLMVSASNFESLMFPFLQRYLIDSE